MEAQVIDKFAGDYFFLSNFYLAPVEYNGILYTCAEAAFQAQKCPERAEEFKDLPPNEAKRLGRKVELRPDWERVKEQIMYEIVLTKFITNPELYSKLLCLPENVILIEGNNWNDDFWGKCTKDGKNKLGQILMRVHKELRPKLRVKDFLPYFINNDIIVLTKDNKYLLKYNQFEGKFIGNISEVEDRFVIYVNQQNNDRTITLIVR